MNNNTYETDNLGLAAFLYLYGPEFLGTRTDFDKKGNKKVYFKFENDANICMSLSREYTVSKEKQYRDCLFILKNEIDKALRTK